ncbi:DUF2158 domain-containing protein [Rhizobium leguminosarum]|uniref:YodC family protein n=1 Tax=Rhizobium leguminosarum TaxID=384 RepID=UPI001C901141|nr:DUF2158 domain-containing protein [Rhizobium leguminosarum]MBY2993768.1 DUF2158 domain-containing protein [Rhizobium leguminosarum]MBY3055218.1 DUF2158 domain-containing protein [Rhizobium leguminosarum]
MDFKAGDIVELKSGGPLMTVKELHSGGELACVWFNKVAAQHYDLKSDYFKSETVKKSAQ